MPEHVGRRLAQGRAVYALEQDDSPEMRERAALALEAAQAQGENPGAVDAMEDIEPGSWPVEETDGGPRAAGETRLDGGTREYWDDITGKRLPLT